jgi:hypothetical protein
MRLTIVLLQFILTAAACFGLWRFWGTLRGRGRSSLIIAAGFLIRALGGQALFWISWLRLPFARSLQLGNGLWVFAIDGQWYLGFARQLIRLGPRAIAAMTTFYPSHLFLQLLTIFTAAFGVVASTAILFNCLAYLATCALILRFRSTRTDFALAAMAFGPSTILWALQPLKDTFFDLLIVAMAAALFRWQAQWRGDIAPKWTSLLATAAAMLFVMYEMAGTRWYFATFVCFLSVIFFVMTRRSRNALIAGAILFLVMTQVLRIGGEDDIPPSVRRFLDPRPSVSEPYKPAEVTHFVAVSRHGFETTPGATTIVPARPSEPPVAVGLTAMFVPRTLAQTLGLMHIGGGRGFWFVAEIDTLVFDAVIFLAIFLCLRGRQTPLSILLALLFFLTAGTMAYTVTNFGTLFRLRQMVYVIAAIAPLTVRRRHEPAPDESRETPAPA